MVLINAVKDVAKALAELISATKCAAGKAADDPSMYQLKGAAKVSAQKRCLSKTRNETTSVPVTAFNPHLMKPVCLNRCEISALCT